MLEMICAHLSDNNLDFSDYASAMEQFFSYISKSALQERIIFTDYYSSDMVPKTTADAIEIFDPINPENNVGDGYFENDRIRMVEAAQEGLDALVEARFTTTKGRAIICWRDVLGPSFMR